MLQLKAGVKKELLEISRTYRLIALVLVFVGFGVLDPVIIRGVVFLAGPHERGPGAEHEPDAGPGTAGAVGGNVCLCRETASTPACW